MTSPRDRTATPDVATNLRVGLLVYEGCDLLDVGGPYEVLLTASRLATRDGAPPPFEVATVGRGPVDAYGGLGLVPSHPTAVVDELDVLVVPGTIDVDGALADPDLVGDVRRLASISEAVVSVCTGSFLLAAAGLLHDRRATTHHEDQADLAARPDVGEVVGDVRWVEDPPVTTGAGLSSGIALGLHLVDRFAGRDLAVRTAAQLEHSWDPEGRDLPAGAGWP